MKRNTNYIFAVQNLKMALKKQTFYNILKAFSSDTPQSIKRQNKGPKKYDEKYNEKYNGLSNLTLESQGSITNLKITNNFVLPLAMYCLIHLAKLLLSTLILRINSFWQESDPGG